MKVLFCFTVYFLLAFFVFYKIKLEQYMIYKTKSFKRKLLLTVFLFIFIVYVLFFTVCFIINSYQIKKHKSQLDILVDTLTMKQVYPSYFNHIKEF